MIGREDVPLLPSDKRTHKPQDALAMIGTLRSHAKRFTNTVDPALPCPLPLAAVSNTHPQMCTGHAAAFAPAATACLGGFSTATPMLRQVPMTDLHSDCRLSPGWSSCLMAWHKQETDLMPN